MLPSEVKSSCLMERRSNDGNSFGNSLGDEGRTLYSSISCLYGGNSGISESSNSSASCDSESTRSSAEANEEYVSTEDLAHNDVEGETFSLWEGE